MSDRLQSLLTRLRTDADLDSAVEDVTRQGAILPVLAALGWDRDNVREVVPEFAIGPGRIDYCLKVGNTKHVYIEVKRASEPLERHEEQLLQYAFKEGVELAVLTNGIAWWLYLPLLPGSWQQRKFFVIHIRDQDPETASASLHRFLAREYVAAGIAQRSAQDEYHRQDKARIIADTLPNAWRELCSTADELLIELFADKVESICGHRPDSDSVADFLARQALLTSHIPLVTKLRSAHISSISTGKRKTSADGSDVSNPWSTRSQSSTVAPITDQQSIPTRLTSIQSSTTQSTPRTYQNTRPTAFILLGKLYKVSTFKDILFGVAEAMHRAHPDRFEQVMILKGRKRLYFSKDGSAMKSPKKLNGTEIFAETNLSANSIIDLCGRLLVMFGYSVTDLKIEAQPKE